MPKKRSKKGKAKPVAPANEDQEMHVDEPGPSTPTIPRESVPEKTEPDNQLETEKEINLESDLADSRIGREVVEESVEESMTGVEEDVRSKSTSGQPEESQTLETKKMTMEERKIKFNELRKKMVGVIHMTVYLSSLSFLLLPQAESSRSNRASLVEEAAKAKMTARDVARLERQRKLAEILRTKADAEDRGEDVERQKNWEYTIEENDEWEKKLARKRRRADFEFHGEFLSSFVNVAWMD
jgi:pre-mRNA-splicing factor SYF2